MSDRIAWLTRQARKAAPGSEERRQWLVLAAQWINRSKTERRSAERE